jgi:serine/threonine protein kinase
MVDRVGQQLGHYRLIRLLGRGGFAEVYLGEHLRLNTQVAVKILHTSLEDDDVAGFLREAQMVAHLKHPHIVRVFDFDVENHTPYLVMDYLPNGNIRRSYPKGTSLPLETIVSYVKQVASALQYAHDQKLIHRDVKPENMLLDRDNTIVLSDFGIALMAQSSRYQSTQEVAGTAAYMAPEQFQGHPHRASDQYALGVVVYEWLTGDRPFHGSFTEIASQHLFVAPLPLHEKVPTILPDVERVVLTALEKDPHRRFESVRAFATALEEACRIAPPRPITLSSELVSPNRPLPPTDTVATSPSSQLSGPPNAATSSPSPTKALSATPLVESFSASNLPNYENTSLVPKTSNDSVVANHRQGLHISRIVLLIGVALLVLLGSPGLFNIIRTNQIKTNYAYATAQANIANTANVASTLSAQATAAAAATATIVAANPDPYPPSGMLVLYDPLSNNSRGYRWDEGTNSGGDGCEFIGGAYHAKQITPNYLHQCVAEATDFSNFTFEVQMTIIKGGAGGIIFCADNAAGKWYNLDISQSGQYSLVRFDHFGAPAKTLASGSASALKTGLNQSNLIAVVANRSTFDLYVNHQKIANISDNTYSHGEIGFIADNPPAEVVYSNAKVWKL